MFCAWEKITACGHNSWCLLERTANLFVTALKTSFCSWFLIRTPWKCVTRTFYSWLFFSFLNPVLHMLVICGHGGVLLSWKINDGDIKLMAFANSSVYICVNGKGRGEIGDWICVEVPLEISDLDRNPSSILWLVSLCLICATAFHWFELHF